jgi:hypothetical protein
MVSTGKTTPRNRAIKVDGVFIVVIQSLRCFRLSHSVFPAEEETCRAANENIAQVVAIDAIWRAFAVGAFVDET